MANNALTLSSVITTIVQVTIPSSSSYEEHVNSKSNE